MSKHGHGVHYQALVQEQTLKTDNTAHTTSLFLHNDYGWLINTTKSGHSGQEFCDSKKLWQGWRWSKKKNKKTKTLKVHTIT